jgi:hypothetical protein
MLPPRNRPPASAQVASTTIRPRTRTTSTAEADNISLIPNPMTGNTDRHPKTARSTNRPRQTTEAIQKRRAEPRKTELCGRPAVSQIEIQSHDTEAPGDRVRFNSQRKTAQYNQIFTPAHVAPYRYETIRAGNKFRNYQSTDDSDIANANCSTSTTTKSIHAVRCRQVSELTYT